VPAGTPNDGFPPSWHPVEGPEPVTIGPRGGMPPMGAPSGDKYFATSIPLPMQLEPDIMLTRYSGGLAAYRIMPPVASGSPALNSAIKSFTTGKA